MSFDARAPGTGESAWARDPRLAAAAEIQLGEFERLVVVAAHPDDETLGAGGLLAAASEAGIAIDVIVVTDGRGSHPESPTHTPSQLAAAREGEVRAAVDILAPDAVLHFLRFADGHIAGLTSSVREGIRSVLGPADPSTALVAPARADGHRDHRIVGEACADLSRDTGAVLLEYPIWIWHWASPGDETIPWPRMQRLPLSEGHRGAKRQAVRAFVSQHTPLSDQPGDEAMLTGDFLAHFDRDAEFFLVEGTPASEPDGTATRALDAHYFDAKYDSSADPWGFETRWYEQRKRAVTVASLPAERYSRALEIGCSIGVLTSELAPACDDLLALDVSQAAVERARARLRDHPGVTVECRDVGADFPSGQFDLIVLSEVGYYFDQPGLERLLDSISAALAPGGTFVACHWRHRVDDYPLTGDFVHHAISLHTDLHRLVAHVERDFLLDVMSPDARSVAERTGLA